MAAGRHANTRREFSHYRHRSGVHQNESSRVPEQRDEGRRSRSRYDNDPAPVASLAGKGGRRHIREDVKEAPPAKKAKFSPITWDESGRATSKDKDELLKPDVVASKKLSSTGDVYLNTVSLELKGVCLDLDSANKLQEFDSLAKSDVEFGSGSAESTLTESPTPSRPLHQTEAMNVDTDIKEAEVLAEDEMQVDDDHHIVVLPIRKSRWASLDDTPAHKSSGCDEHDSGKFRSGASASSGRDSHTSSPECGEFIRDDSDKARSRTSSEVDDSDSEVNDADTRIEDAEAEIAEVPKNLMWDSCRDVFDYERLNKINEGTYGIVYRARNKKTGEIVALKKVKLEGEREGFPVTALREIKFLMSIDHPSLVRGKEVVMGDLDSVFVVMEYMEHDLKGLMEVMKHPFSTCQVKCLMLQLLKGIQYLHDNWVIHRDLKSSNILFNNQGELKICDFGMARQYANPLKPYTALVVTLWYRAPELLFGEKQYSEAVDMWSVGCIMAELLNKDPLFQGKTEVDQIDKIVRTLGTPEETIWPGFSKLSGSKAKFVMQPVNNLRKKFPVTSFTGAPTLSAAGFDLLSGLLTYDPVKRINVHEALNHPWFQEVPMAASKESMPTFPAQNGRDRTVKRAVARR